jgi:methylmalonyl-CoA mutase C-terminal domain/subunit
MVKERSLSRPAAPAADARALRVLVTTLGLDLHDLGARVIGKGLADAGMQVIIGNRLSPEEATQIAVQEDVDVIGLSVLHGAHRYLLPTCVKALRQAGRDDILVIAGGTIPAADVPQLKAQGVAEVFRSGTSIAEIVAYLGAYAAQHRPGDRS